MNVVVGGVPSTNSHLKIYTSLNETILLYYRIKLNSNNTINNLVQ